MASEVFNTKIITLLDGTEVELRPLAIAKLRKFMRIWTEHVKDVTDKITASQLEKEGETAPAFTESDLTDAQFDAYIKMSALALEKELKKDDWTDKKFIAYLEDTLDEQTIFTVLDVCGGLKVGNNDPNLTDPENRPGQDGMN